MCGVTAYWARESLLTRVEYDMLLEGAAQRGDDGVGVVVYDPKARCVVHTGKWLGAYQDVKDEVLDMIEHCMGLGNIFIANLRATPETENMTTSTDMLQPIENIDCLLVHNGGVSDSIRDELCDNEGFEFKTQIDSELILAVYHDQGRNLKATMETIVGSFAAIMIDMRKNKLYSITSFNPLSHGYIRGYGYILHSDNDAIGKVLHSLTRMSYDGLNVWESWYHHPLRGYSIIDTDLESGFQFNQSFEPRFLHPVWQPSKEMNRVKWLVSTSGGIDSGLTAFILHRLGYDVEMVHFDYGQKSRDCELWAVQQQAEHMGIDLRVFDLREMNNQIGEAGMLTNRDVAIDTGGSKIKSTIAWTCGRNLLFSSIILARAEALIVSNEYDGVNIAAGWAQLSEETGGYPDNSSKFADALNEIKNYGLITGSKINFVPLMQRVTKTECWALGNDLGFPFHLTVSCDDPKMIDGVPHLCTECGSTRLSILASDRAGVDDRRNFIGDRPALSGIMSVPDSVSIARRLVVPESYRVDNMLTTAGLL